MTKGISKRQAALVACKVAGYHKDTPAFTRAYIVGRISRKAADDAWRSGERARAAGVPCDCYQCKKVAP